MCSRCERRREGYYHTAEYAKRNVQCKCRALYFTSSPIGDADMHMLSRCAYLVPR